jgi:hypothetical protein
MKFERYEEVPEVEAKKIICSKKVKLAEWFTKALLKFNGVFVWLLFSDKLLNILRVYDRK